MIITVFDLDVLNLRSVNFFKFQHSGSKFIILNTKELDFLFMSFSQIFVLQQLRFKLFSFNIVQLLEFVNFIIQQSNLLSVVSLENFNLSELIINLFFFCDL